MKSKSNLRYKIWLYLIVFSLSILLCLWLFQVIFLDGYYKWYKTKELINTIETITTTYNEEKYEEILDNISHDKGVCIELIQNNKLKYISTLYNKGCIVNIDGNYDYKKDFINSENTSARYTLKNPRFDNQTLVLGVKLNPKTNLFVSASLEPLDATVRILRSQLFYITLLVIILSLMVFVLF